MDYGKNQTEKKIKSANSKKKKYKKRAVWSFFKGFFILLLFFGLMLGGIAFGALKGIIASAPEINMESIVPSGYATTIYDSAGNVADTLVTAGSNREEATYNELPQDLIDAFIAIEDARFWDHNGIDLRAILRAVSGILTGKSSGGGSTITQQLIKNNVFNGGMEKTFGEKVERKLQEQYLALQLDKAMSKELIITNYLNTINLGNNTLGVKVAARRYFGKDVSELTLSECSVLAGITQNPAALNPISGKERNAEKRKVILQYMHDQGYITKQEQEEALEDDVYARIQNVDLATKETATPYSYFTDELVEQVKEALIKKLGYSETQAHNLLYSGGLSIYTTQDPVIQTIVDEEINNPANYSAARYSMEYRLSLQHPDGTATHYSEENIKTYHKKVLNNTSYDGLYDNEEKIQADIDAYKAYLMKEGDIILGERLNTTLQPQASFVLMDQKTGHVKAISGGRGTKTASLTLNRATNTRRQPGSTFKTISVFAPALDTKGDTLGSVYYDSVYTVGNKTFSNWYSQGYQGYSSIRDGIAYSMNIVAVRALMETVTPQLGIEYAENFGITTLVPDDLNASTALGGLTDGVTNLELTGAYATIANGGVYQQPIFFTKILDHDGKVLIDNTPSSRRVLKESTAFLLTDAMADSITGSKKFGSSISPTSTRANIPNMAKAGKSGTTSANNDIWFVGYTPYYTAGIWAGADNNQKLTSKNGGTSFHKDIWKKIMTRVHEGLSNPGFPVPKDIHTAEICRKSGKLAVAGLCTSDPRGSSVYTEYFATGTAPTEACNIHVQATICTESSKLATDYCPTTTSSIFLAIPLGDETATADSIYAMPSDCNIHTESSKLLPIESTIEESAPILNQPPSSSKAVEETITSGPGYTPPIQLPNGAPIIHPAPGSN